ncbi:MAG: DUF4390 domain-containing protein [Gammaproteobacteria bacterium]|jgi:hypothetical protein
MYPEKITIHRPDNNKPMRGGISRQARRALAVVLLLLVSASVQAAGFVINHAEIVLSDKVYQLNARLSFNFSNDVMNAIENGVPIVVNVDIEILSPRRYFWDEEVASLEQRYQLQYHALSEQYLVRNLNSGAQYTFFSLTAALQQIGNIDHLPIIDQQLLVDKAEEKYYARLRVALGVDNLPVPLRLNALVSPSWWLDSEWFELEL